MTDDSMMVTILTYHSNKVKADVEVFFHWHGGEHRVNDLIADWGDIEHWIVTNDDGYVYAVNENLGAEITLRLRELKTDGHES